MPCCNSMNPGKRVKTDPELVKVVLNLGLQYLTVLSVTVRPFLPFAADRLRTMLNLRPLQDEREWLDLLNELAEGNPVMQPNHALNEGRTLV